MNLRPILKLAAPTALALLLAGCITDPYQYRAGYGDYYYGRPSVDYRHHGYYGGYGYPSYYGRSGWSFSLGYGYPYGYPYGRYGRYGGYGYGGWPYWYGGYGGWPGYPPIVIRPRPDHDPGGQDRDDDGRPPWRDLDNLRDGGPNPPIQGEPRLPRMSSQPPPRVRTAPPPRPQPSVDRPSRPVYDGSRVQRAREVLRERDER